MNTPMQPHDQDLEALLSEDSELIRRYRALPLSEPGKHLDAAILGKATNAVRRPAARQRWLIPIASAASVVAAAGIGWRVHVAQKQEEAAATAPAEKYEVMEIDLQSGDKRRALDTAIMPPQTPAPPAEALGKVQAEEKVRPSLSDIIQGPARDNGVVIEEPHTRSDHANGGLAPEQRQAMPAPMNDAFEGNQAAAAAPATSAPAPMPAKEAADDLDEVVVTGSRAKRERQPAEAEAESSRRFEELQRDGAPEPVLAPIDWIERIRALIRARRMTQVRDEIDRFRQAYPSYRLPSDISRYER